MNIYKILSVTILDLICRVGITEHCEYRKYMGKKWEFW